MLRAFCRRYTTSYHVIYHPTTRRVVVTSHPSISDSRCRIVVRPIDIIDTLRNLRRHIHDTPIVFFDTHYTLTPVMWFHFVDSVASNESSDDSELAPTVPVGIDL